MDDLVILELFKDDTKNMLQSLIFDSIHKKCNYNFIYLQKKI